MIKEENTLHDLNCGTKKIATNLNFSYRDVCLASPVVEQLENDDGFVGGRLEDGAPEDGADLAVDRLRHPDVAAAVRKLGEIRRHAQLHLGAPDSGHQLELERGK
jgi:hypothetical protein